MALTKIKLINRNLVTIGGTLSASGLTFPTADGTSGQAITTDGSGNLSFSTITGGTNYGDANVASYLSAQGFSNTSIEFTDLSVTTAAASGNGALSYNNVSGVFTYTPPDLSSYLTSDSDSQTLSLSGNTLSISGSGSTVDLSSFAGGGSGGSGASVTVSDSAPGSPSAGDLWFDSEDLVLYVYYNDGSSSQWVKSIASGIPTPIALSTSAPSSANEGDLWFDTNLLKLYIYYNDGDSSQWIEINSLSGNAESGGSASSNFVEKTANAAIIAGEKYIIDTSASAITITLPSSATIGDEVRIIDGAGFAANNNITIARNGHKIQGSASDLVIDTNRAGFGLAYYNTTNGWVLIER